MDIDKGPNSINRFGRCRFPRLAPPLGATEAALEASGSPQAAPS